jgi:hypothetical protein
LRFSKKKAAAAGAAVLIAAVTAAAGGSTAAKAATPSCGPTCADIFSRDFGTHFNPQFVLDVFHGSAKVGQKIILFRQSNSDRAEDFSAEFDGLAADFYAAGLLPSQVALHYGCAGTVAVAGAQIPCGPASVDDPAFEIEYSPLGEESSLCVGLASTAVSGEKVTLQPCGVSARTVWIADLNDSPSTITHGYVPVINGSDTNFSHPYVLTYPAAGYPTDIPRPQLEVRNLTGFSQGNVPLGNPIGNVNSNQLWGADFGILK